jgi:hypothetical protein
MWENIDLHLFFPPWFFPNSISNLTPTALIFPAPDAISFNSSSLQSCPCLQAVPDVPSAKPVILALQFIETFPIDHFAFPGCSGAVWTRDNTFTIEAHVLNGICEEVVK